MHDLRPDDLLAQLLAQAQKLGADAADALWQEQKALSAHFRLQAPADVTAEQEREISLRVLVSKKDGYGVALVRSTDLSKESLAQLAERAVSMAGAAPPDPYAGLAVNADLARNLPTPARLDENFPDARALSTRAEAAEAAALSHAGIGNSEGADASWQWRHSWLATSAGFLGEERAARHALSISVLAGEGTQRVRDYMYSVATELGALKSPEELGNEAARRTLRRRNPVKLATGLRPVVFEPRAARSLLGHFLGAIQGSSVARGTSFLQNHLGKAVFPSGFSIREAAQREGGLRNRSFDGEGLLAAQGPLVEDGVLQSWLLDQASARQLKMKAQGHAQRGLGGIGAAAANVWIAPGKTSEADLMADIDDGLYVTELMGQGVNPITGDYSRGASGFHIVNGKLAEPVSEITLAGRLTEMFLRLRAADNLAFENGIDSPSLRVDGMMIAGTD